MSKFQPGDKVYINEKYDLNPNWHRRPGVVVRQAEVETEACYFVNLPAWNGLPEWTQAALMQHELDAAL